MTFSIYLVFFSNWHIEYLGNLKSDTCVSCWIKKQQKESRKRFINMMKYLVTSLRTVESLSPPPSSDLNYKHLLKGISKPWDYVCFILKSRFKFLLRDSNAVLILTSRNIVQNFMYSLDKIHVLWKTCLCSRPIKLFNRPWKVISLSFFN